MALEDLTGPNKYIANLVVTNPLAADDRREGDDHIRGIKNVLTNTFGALDHAVNLGAGGDFVKRAGDTMAGPLLLPDGTAAAPSLAFGDESDNGIYSAAADEINFANAGVQKFRFNSAAASSSGMTINSPAGAYNTLLVGAKAGLPRWNVNLGDVTAETGAGNAGSNFTITRYSDAGAAIDSPLSIPRTSGDVWHARNITVGSAVVGAAAAAGIIANNTEASLVMYGIGGAPAYKLQTAVATGDVFMVTNNAVRATWKLDSSFIVQGPGKGWQVGGGPWMDASDERTKEDIQPYTSGLAQILELRPVSFRFKAATERGDARYIRLIAQEAMRPMPELVSVAPGKLGQLEYADLHSLNEGPVLWALVNAVKELAARVEQLEATVAGV